jgi:hypothetical protein
MITLQQDIADYLRRMCPARTDESLMPRFGISYNTLRKIEHGEPIRKSVAERLTKRIHREIEASGCREQLHARLTDPHALCEQAGDARSR